MPKKKPKKSPASNKNLRTAVNVIAIVVGMFMLAYASVPLYRIFCQVTGFGGTTQVAKKLPDKIYKRQIKIRFNSDVDSNLPWKFTPDQQNVTVKVGENKLVSYYAENLTDTPVKGMASYNVLPESAGIYFNKVQCFCFEEQVLQPRQKVHMPISFFIDPAILSDTNMKGVDTITLSYTFFKVKGKN